MSGIFCQRCKDSSAGCTCNVPGVDKLYFPRAQAIPLYNINPIQLGVYKIDSSVDTPKYGTQQSACFDLCFNKCDKTSIQKFKDGFSWYDEFYEDNSFQIKPGEICMVPTGIIFDIPKDYSLRIHVRSSVALKMGLIMVNGEAIIDSDYFHESFLLLTNIGRNSVKIENKTRLAQAELVPVYRMPIIDLDERPTQKTDRIGGLGSTGKK